MDKEKKIIIIASATVLVIAICAIIFGLIQKNKKIEDTSNNVIDSKQQISINQYIESME